MMNEQRLLASLFERTNTRADGSFIIQHSALNRYLPLEDLFGGTGHHNTLIAHPLDA
jgi:hypothetical protein